MLGMKVAHVPFSRLCPMGISGRRNTQRALFVTLISCLAACSLQSPTSEAHSNLLGMTQKQISSCLGAPTQKTTEGVAEARSYAAGQSCLVKIDFAYGRASRVNYVGLNGKPLSPGDECQVVGEKCAMR
jgi:hypothetical protein